MIRQPISRWSYVALGVASFVTLAAIYTMLSEYVHARQPDNKTIPTWQQIWHEGVVGACKFRPRSESLPFFEWDEVKKELVQKQKITVAPPLIWVDGTATLWRLVYALGLSTLVAVPLGVLMGCYSFVEAYFLPPLSFLAKIPATAMLAVFLTLAQTDGQFYLGCIIFGLIPILAQTIFHAAKDDVPEELLFKARTLGAGQFDCIWEVIFRYILPKVMEAVRLQIGPAIIYLIAAEWALGDVGFGCTMRLQQKSLGMSIIFTYLITLGLFGLFVDRALIWLQSKICPWHAH